MESILYLLLPRISQINYAQRSKNSPPNDDAILFQLINVYNIINNLKKSIGYGKFLDFFGVLFLGLTPPKIRGVSLVSQFSLTGFDFHIIGFGIFTGKIIFNLEILGKMEKILRQIITGT